MSNAGCVHSTPISVTESTIASRLQRAGLRLERRGEYYALLYGQKILLATGGDGKPLTLAQLDHYTRRFQ